MADDRRHRHPAQERVHPVREHRGIQIQTDARRFAKIRGAEEHVAAAGHTLIGRTVLGRQVVQPEPLLRR